MARATRLVAALLFAAAALSVATAAQAAPLPRRALLQTFFGGGANGADTNGMFEEFGGGVRNSAFFEGYPGVQSNNLASDTPPGPLGLPDGGAGFEWPTTVAGGGLVVPAATKPNGGVACGTVGLAYEDVSC